MNDPIAFRRPARRGMRISPIFLAFVALTAFGGWLSYDDSRSGARFGVFCLVIGGWMVSLCLHEFGHAYTAYRAGDHSVEAAGYLTLNPLKYAHPFLSIVLPLIFIAQGGIGLPGGAVYLHKQSFRSRAMQSAASAAGPLSNVLFALIVLLIVRSHADARARPLLVRRRVPRLPPDQRRGTQPAAHPGPGRVRDHRAVPGTADRALVRADQAMGHAGRVRSAAGQPDQRLVLRSRRVTSIDATGALRACCGNSGYEFRVRFSATDLRRRLP